MFKFFNKRVNPDEMLMRHYTEISAIYAEMRGWRHDYHSHLQTMKSLIALNQIEELSRYMDGLEHSLDRIDTMLKTGNTIADAVINSKLSLAALHGIKVDAAASVPEELPLSEIDFCVILGNLMDNAIESGAAIEDPENRFLRLYIDTIKRQFYISVVNSMAERGSIFPQKGQTRRRGLGLRRIDAAVARNGGYVNRQQEPGVFATEVMIPLPLPLSLPRQ